jgi:oligoendopeptidase F
MSFDALPKTAHDLTDWSWSQIEPYYANLQNRVLSAANVNEWLADWTRIAERVAEARTRLAVATTQNTADEDIARRYHAFLENIVPAAEAAEQKLKVKLLQSGLEPDGFAIPLRNMRAEADLFRQENLPLLVEEEKLGTEYDRISGAQTVEWDGQTLTLEQLTPFLQDPDRTIRERAWRAIAQRQFADRNAINAIWIQLLDLRRRIASNVGCTDYREYAWRKKLRFDYTPEDALRFHHAVETVVVPVRSRLLEKRRRRLGVETLRPWDLNVDPRSLPPLRPYQTVDELENKTGAIFDKVDPQLGSYFDAMQREKLLDLDNRLHKAPGGYMESFAAARQPFIFMNAVGLHDDVNTLFHEGGHAFHEFESRAIPYYQQRTPPIEFSEVASMAMELLAAPYLDGSFYSAKDAARARIEHLENILFIWPFVAVGDAFQHWIYTNLDVASDPLNCDAKYAQLWERFMPGMDWSGLEVFLLARWRRILHFFKVPFYYLEYALAQLGAVQVWANALQDQSKAVAQYRHALSLGGNATLPDLFTAAGARFAFDANTLREAVQLIERTIAELDED